MPPRTRSAAPRLPVRERPTTRDLTEEMQASFLTYSMSVITSRALPDVRDGLKPVNRRILYAMHELGLRPTQAYKKAATVVGDVLGKYHPHGDASVYDALVRMVQDFSLRYPLVEGQGNFGSLDGDPAAAYRYTEARMAATAVAMLDGIAQDTVPFVPNFDDRLAEPALLPAALPNLLINGSSGIAVGMATNMPPHNLREIGRAIIRVLEEPSVSLPELRKLVKGPDFPTGGLIVGKAGIQQYLETGRGRLIVRARVHLEAKAGSTRQQLVVTELPYQANKARIIEQIAGLVKDEKLDGISALRDESDRDGVRMVIELKRDASAKVVLPRLFKLTGLEVTFGVINLALTPQDGVLVPRVLGLRDLIDAFIAHRHQVLVRRTTFELEKAKSRLHIVEGLLVAVRAIDAVVRLIRRATDPADAHRQLRKAYPLSDLQADAILAMRLARLTGLEVQALDDEARALRGTIADLTALLGSVERRMSQLATETHAMMERFGDARRTEIITADVATEVAATLEEAEVVGVLTADGRLFHEPLPPGRSRVSAPPLARREDLALVRTRLRVTETMLLVAEDGTAFGVFANELPTAQRRGVALSGLMQWPTVGTRPARVVLGAPVRDYRHPFFVTLLTAQGAIKRTTLWEFRNARLAGVRAIRLDDGDYVVAGLLTRGDEDLAIVTRAGQVIRFTETTVRDMGREAGGVRAIALKGEDQVVGAVTVRADGALIAATADGYAKRVPVTAIPRQGRGGQGVQLLVAAERAGPVLGCTTGEASAQSALQLTTGALVPVAGEALPEVGRAIRSVRLPGWPLGGVATEFLTGARGGAGE